MHITYSICSYNAESLTRVPIVDGMDPFSWLLFRYLFEISMYTKRIWFELTKGPTSKCAYKWSNSVRFPMLEGISPLSLLFWR